MFEFEIKGLKVIALSDTHGLHRNIPVPPCDVLIHAGDACDFGMVSRTTRTIQDFRVRES